MTHRFVLRNVWPAGFLSYGPESDTPELLRLNVIIGPSASGKSNFLEALAMLRATACDLRTALHAGGGIAEYVWKKQMPEDPYFMIAALVSVPGADAVLFHGFSVMQIESRAELTSEEVSEFDNGVERKIYCYADGIPAFYPATLGRFASRAIDAVQPDRSVLSQRRAYATHPEIGALASEYGKITLFRGWDFGPRSVVRAPQPADLPTGFLLPDAGNLALVLREIVHAPEKRAEIVAHLRLLYPSATDVRTKVAGGTIQLFVEEDGGLLIPAARLSDGTLRYLCMLAILLHPDPPPVIGIEQPEMGLHPDILPTIADLLRKASERTQLIVTTHSDTLVSALSDTPECILVCESTPNGTAMKRLDPEPLREWLEKYSLGEIWRMGEIGGNRW